MHSLRHSLTRSLLASMIAFASFGASQPLFADDWGRFRGPNGSGIATQLDLPDTFSLSENLLWKIESGQGNSSVVGADNLLFVSSFTATDRVLSCYDLESGELRWQKNHPKRRTETATPPNSPATCSPVCNENLVAVHFPDTGVMVYDHAGNLRWEKDIGPFYSMHGISSSPILVDDKLVLVIDQLQASYAIALELDSGKEAWRADRLLGVTGGYSSPLLYPFHTKQLILSAAPGELVGYHAETGERAFTTLGVANAPVGQPVIVGDRLYYSEPPGERIPMEALGPADKNKDGVIELEEVKNSVGAYRLIERIDSGFGNNDGKVNQEEWDASFGTFLNRGGLCCIKLNEEDGKIEGEVAWKYSKATPYISSVVVVENTVYIVNDGGVLVSLDAATGKVQKQGRLTEATGDYYASPIASGSRLVLASREGKVSLVQHGPEWEVLNTVDFEEPIVATPTICQGKLLIRSGKFLYCLGKRS